MTTQLISENKEPVLSPELLEKYRVDGYFVLPDFLNQDEVARLKAATNELVENSRSVTKSNAIYDLEDTHSAAEPRVRRIKRPEVNHPEYDRILRHPRILAVLQTLIGPNLRSGSSKVNMKSAGFGSPVEWHQDWAFYPQTNQDVLAVGVMIDDCEPDNGPMLIVPGSHTGPVYDHHSDGCFAGAIDPKQSGIDFSTAAPCLGKAGSVTVHHVRAVHGSAPNMSAKDRRFLIFAYRAADAWPLLGFTPEGAAERDFETFESMMVSGTSTLEPRMESVPVRMPLPRSIGTGGIYEIQRQARNTFFK